MVSSERQCKADGVNFLSTSWAPASKPRFIVVYAILFFLPRRKCCAYQSDGFMMLANICKRLS